MTIRDRAKGGWCRKCALRAPSGKCLAPGLKSGRCGDWVWYMRGSKQHRRRHVVPKDPRTPAQLYWRKRLAAASRKYSHSLTDEQLDACIAAGAKVRCRPRLGQSGWLTGQQYWVRVECRIAQTAQPPQAKTAFRGRSTEFCPQVPPRQSVTRSTWEQHRSSTSVAPLQVANRAGALPLLNAFSLRKCAFRAGPARVQPPRRCRRGVRGQGRGPPEPVAMLRKTI